MTKRERFEKWAGQHLCLPLERRFSDVEGYELDYIYEPLNHMYVAWQASAREQMERDAKIVKDYSFGNASDAIRESFEREAGKPWGPDGHKANCHYDPNTPCTCGWISEIERREIELRERRKS